MGIRRRPTAVHGSRRRRSGDHCGTGADIEFRLTGCSAHSTPAGAATAFILSRAGFGDTRSPRPGRAHPPSVRHRAHRSLSARGVGPPRPRLHRFREPPDRRSGLHDRDCKSRDRQPLPWGSLAPRRHPPLPRPVRHLYPEPAKREEAVDGRATDFDRICLPAPALD